VYKIKCEQKRPNELEDLARQIIAVCDTSLFRLHASNSHIVNYDNSIGNYLIYMDLTRSTGNCIKKPFLAMSFAVTLIAGLGILSIPNVSYAQRVMINGAGATFPFPLIDTWRVEYQTVKPDVNVNYQSIGSGGGVKQFIEKEIY
jgi:hypothetical protein